MKERLLEIARALRAGGTRTTAAEQLEQLAEEQPAELNIAKLVSVRRQGSWTGPVIACSVRTDDGVVVNMVREQPEERRQGHSALRVRDGALERFDPNPPSAPSAAAGKTPRDRINALLARLVEDNYIDNRVPAANAIGDILDELERDLEAERAERRHQWDKRKAAESSAPSSEAVAPEVRLNDDGSLDEVVAPGFQLEQMDFNHWFLEIVHGGQAVAVWLHAKGKITASYEHRNWPSLMPQDRMKEMHMTSIADMIPKWFEGETVEQQLDEAFAQIRILEQKLSARPAEGVATQAASIIKAQEQRIHELEQAIAASCDEDRAEILSRGHGGCPLLARSASECTRDGTHYGKDCPKGMVQVEFVGVDPKLRYSDYGWKPSPSAFLDVWVDGKRFNIHVGDLKQFGHEGKRGIHVNFSIPATVQNDAMNALSITLGTDHG